MVCRLMPTKLATRSGAVYEGSTRVAALMCWPGHNKPRTAVDEMIHEVDLHPTLLGVRVRAPLRIVMATAVVHLIASSA